MAEENPMKSVTSVGRKRHATSAWIPQPEGYRSQFRQAKAGEAARTVPRNHVPGNPIYLTPKEAVIFLSEAKNRNFLKNAKPVTNLDLPFRKPGFNVSEIMSLRKMKPLNKVSSAVEWESHKNDPEEWCFRRMAELFMVELGEIEAVKFGYYGNNLKKVEFENFMKKKREKGKTKAKGRLPKEQEETVEGAFLCVICGKGLCKKGHLSGHLKSHLGLREYMCSFCDYSAVQNNALMSHYEGLHGFCREFAADLISVDLEALKSNEELLGFKRHVRGITAAKKYKARDGSYKTVSRRPLVLYNKDDNTNRVGEEERVLPDDDNEEDDPEELPEYEASNDEGPGSPAGSVFDETFDNKAVEIPVAKKSKPDGIPLKTPKVENTEDVKPDLKGSTATFNKTDKEQQTTQEFLLKQNQQLMEKLVEMTNMNQLLVKKLLSQSSMNNNNSQDQAMMNLDKNMDKLAAGNKNMLEDQTQQQSKTDENLNDSDSKPLIIDAQEIEKEMEDGTEMPLEKFFAMQKKNKNNNEVSKDDKTSIFSDVGNKLFNDTKN